MHIHFCQSNSFLSTFFLQFHFIITSNCYYYCNCYSCICKLHCKLYTLCSLCSIHSLSLNLKRGKKRWKLDVYSVNCFVVCNFHRTFANFSFVFFRLYFFHFFNSTQAKLETSAENGRIER